jgi:hypothetical protein
MPLRNFVELPTQVCNENQRTRETSLRKKPSNRRMNPPRKSRGIQDLLLPVATREMHSAINHMNKASFRITYPGL